MHFKTYISSTPRYETISKLDFNIAFLEQVISGFRTNRLCAVPNT